MATKKSWANLRDELGDNEVMAYMIALMLRKATPDQMRIIYTFVHSYLKKQLVGKEV